MTRRKPAAPVFKPYPFGQLALLPRQYDEFIPPDHVVRVISEVIERLDLRTLEAQYKGGGTSSYHPRMLLRNRDPSNQFADRFFLNQGRPPRK